MLPVLLASQTIGDGFIALIAIGAACLLACFVGSIVAPRSRV